mmetsp:Transcript_28591/g.80580  ORF Transcript_28591/g.80580 Transcript_28591/m.80580 type:complete len:468 (+) Transcript_28591:117-1520(+)
MTTHHIMQPCRFVAKHFVHRDAMTLFLRRMPPSSAISSSSLCVDRTRSFSSAMKKKNNRNANDHSNAAATVSNRHFHRQQQQQQQKNVHVSKFFSSSAAIVEEDWDDADDDYHSYYQQEHGHERHINHPGAATKHCPTCACDHDQHHDDAIEPGFPCGSSQHEDALNNLPPPLPEPSYSVHMRVMPPTSTALRSPEGKQRLQDALLHNTAEQYLALMEQFMNQSDPAFCGVTTLCMVLNALGVDPNVRWRGGWRWYGSEDVLLDRCCLSTERIRRIGITMEEFQQLGRCQGAFIDLKRPLTAGPDDADNRFASTLQQFRNDILQHMSSTDDVSTMIVASFSRSALGQTGDGHFSPLAAYHAPTDSVLVLDVARFKYAPYWVTVEDLYRSMQPKDAATQKSRGWFLMRNPAATSRRSEDNDDDDIPSIEEMERRRPAATVPIVGDGDACPIGSVKVEYCRVNPHAHHR